MRTKFDELETEERARVLQAFHELVVEHKLTPMEQEGLAFLLGMPSDPTNEPR